MISLMAPCSVSTNCAIDWPQLSSTWTTATRRLSSSMKSSMGRSGITIRRSCKLRRIGVMSFSRLVHRLTSSRMCVISLFHEND
jgi:hypothetical protein